MRRLPQTVRQKRGRGAGASRMPTFGRGHCALFVEHPFGKEARAKKLINAAEPIKAGEPLAGTDQHRTELAGAGRSSSEQVSTSSRLQGSERSCTDRKAQFACLDLGVTVGHAHGHYVKVAVLAAGNGPRVLELLGVKRRRFREDSRRHDGKKVHVRGFGEHLENPVDEPLGAFLFGSLAREVVVALTAPGRDEAVGVKDVSLRVGRNLVASNGIVQGKELAVANEQLVAKDEEGAAFQLLRPVHLCHDFLVRRALDQACKKRLVRLQRSKAFGINAPLQGFQGHLDPEVLARKIEQQRFGPEVGVFLCFIYRARAAVRGLLEKPHEVGFCHQGRPAAPTLLRVLRVLRGLWDRRVFRMQLDEGDVSVARNLCHDMVSLAWKGWQGGRAIDWAIDRSVPAIDRGGLGKVSLLSRG